VDLAIFLLPFLNAMQYGLLRLMAAIFVSRAQGLVKQA